MLYYKLKRNILKLYTFLNATRFYVRILYIWKMISIFCGRSNNFFIVLYQGK